MIRSTEYKVRNITISSVNVNCMPSKYQEIILMTIVLGVYSDLGTSVKT